MRYSLPRFGGKGQNQRDATFWHHKSIDIVRLNCKLFLIRGPFRSKNKTWYSNKNPVFKCMAFFMKCADEAFYGVPRKGHRDAENWNRVWVWHGLLFWYMFGTIYCFSHSDTPSTHCDTCWKWSFNKHCVCPSVLPQSVYECRVITTTAWDKFMQF